MIPPNQSGYSRPCNPNAGISERQQKKLRPADPMDIVPELTDIGISSYNLGKPENAYRCFSEALHKIDPQSTRTSQTFPSSSTSEQQSPEYDEGMNVYNKPIRIIDPLDASTHATLLYNVALTYSTQDQYQVALIWFEKSFERCAHDFASHKMPVIAVMIKHNMSHCCFRLGQYDAAVKHIQEALSLPLSTGPEPSDLAALLSSYGVLLFHGEKNDMTEALELLQESLKIYRSTRGSDSREAATALNNIGRIHYLLEDYENALSVYNEAKQIRRQILGENSIDYAATVYNAGQALKQLGHHDGAMNCYKEFVRIASMHFGSNSGDIALAYRGIAEIHHGKSELKQSLHFLTLALEMQRASFGDKTPEAASSLNRLGNLCFDMRDYHAALEHYKNGLEVERTIFEPNHPHIIVTMTNIAHIYMSCGQHREALRTYQTVKRMQQHARGENCLESAETISSIGLMQYLVCDFEGAFESYQEALRIRRAHYGTDEHPEVASTLNSVGMVLFRQEMFPLAQSCFSESLRIRQLVLGPDHRDVASLWFNLATIQLEMGQDETAIKYYQETLRVERAALGNSHPDVLRTLERLGQVSQQIGQLEESLKYFDEVLEIHRKAETIDETSIARILNLIGNTNLQLGNTREMMESFTEALRIYRSQQVPASSLVIAGFKMYGLRKTNPPGAAVA